VVALSILGPHRANLVPALGAYTVAFAALLSLVRRNGGFLDDTRVLLGGAFLLRLVLLPALPDLSDDLYRYIWDGWLTASGVNPYLYAPSDPALTTFQGSPLFQAMNSPDYHSVYPPLSQLVFLFGGVTYAAIGWPGAAYAVKAGFLALEMTGIVFLLLALRRLGRRPRFLALYAWNPLVLVTVAGGGHTEGGLLAGLGLLAFGVAGGGRRRAWIGLVLASASKGIPLLLAPLLFRRHWREAGLSRTVLDALPAALVGLTLLLPFLRPGVLSAVSGSADLYVRLFEFNAGLYFLLKEASFRLTGEDFGKVIGPALRWILLATVGVISLRCPIRDAGGWFRGALLIFGLYLAMATTVHPWYLLWGLALIPLTTLNRAAWMWASWAAFLTWFTYVGVPHLLLTGIFWGGVGAFLLLEFDILRPFDLRLRDFLLRVAGRRKAAQVDPFIGAGRILDLGAAEGHVARNLDRPDRRLFLMDVGNWFVAPLPGVVYDGATLPLGDRSVDTVLLSLVLHHTEDPDRIITEALRVCSTRLVVTESTYRWEWERRLLEMLDRFANRTRGMDSGKGSRPQPIAFRKVEEWEAAFARAGGRVIRSSRLNRVGHRHHLFVVEPITVEPVTVESVMLEPEG